MRLFKPSYKDRQGKACKTQAWYVELRIAGEAAARPRLLRQGRDGSVRTEARTSR